MMKMMKVLVKVRDGCCGEGGCEGGGCGGGFGGLELALCR